MKRKQLETPPITISERRYKAGYILIKQRFPDYDNVIMVSAFTMALEYIGNPKAAHRLIVKRGIAPQLIPGHNVCSIGYCAREKKWYGWSHRAIFGFKVGDRVKKGDCTNSSGFTEEYLASHPEKDRSLPIGFKAKTLDDCKLMAIAFAESVG